MARPAALPSHGLLAGMLLTLAACGAPSGQQAASGNDGAAPDAASGAISAGGGAPAPDPALATPAPDAAAQSAAAAPLACSADIGAAAAERLARTCRNVSPATRPPCNVANSCAIMQDEIARSCALFDGKGEPMDGCGPDPKGMAAAADVVKRYYAALNARAMALPGRNGGMTARPTRRWSAFARALPIRARPK